MNRDHFWLTDRQFARIAPHLPTDTRGKPRVDDRRVISGIVHVLKSGARWVDAPTVYGPRKTLYNRYVRWAAKGVWVNLFHSRSRNGSTRGSDRNDLSRMALLSGLLWRLVKRCALLRERSVRSPMRDVRPRRSLPPVERCTGVRPTQAAKSRPERNVSAGGASASRAVAISGPPPERTRSVHRLPSFAHYEIRGSPE